MGKHDVRGPSWRIPDALWARMEPLLPKIRLSKKGGRPRVDARVTADGIFYILRTGCQWKAAPSEFGSGSTLHRYFQEWERRGVFQKLWRLALEEYEELKGIEWTWQSIDGAMTKAPLGGEKDGTESHGSREKGHQTVLTYRRRRRTHSARDGRGKRG
jgi:transposase